MFILYADKNRLRVREREALTSGSVNVYTARFEFSPDWEGLKRKAVFKAGKESRTVLLDETGECTVPWEVLGCHGLPLMAGVFGTQDGTVLPTAGAGLGFILEGGPTGGEGGRPPTPEAWEEELAKKGDTLGYTPEGGLGLYAGDRLLSAVPGCGEGVSDHQLLSGRDAGGQHPISSITGLADALNRIPEPVEALTNEELEALLK